MKAKLTQAEYDSLTDTNAKAAYEKAGDVYYFTGEIPDVTKLQSALDSERTRADNAERSIATFKGVDVERYKTLVAADDAARATKLGTGEGVKTEIDQMRADFEQKLKERDERETNLKIDSTLKDLLVAAGVVREAIPDALDAARKRVKSVDGRLVVLSTDGKATADAVDQWISTGFKSEKSWFFADDGTGGTGSSVNNRGVTGQPVIKVDREASKQNPALYRQAKEQAAKTGATIDLGQAATV